MDALAACRHCSQPLPSLAEGGYCCAGCRTAHEVISACGLDAFYRLRRGEAGTPVPVAVSSADGWLDGADFARRHVRRLDDHRSLIRWRVEGIHCSACVWLLEHLPRLDPGIAVARVELAADALLVVFDPTRCTPGRQAAIAASLGYVLRPWSGQGAGDREERRREVLRLVVSMASAVGAMHVVMNLLAGGLTGDLDAASQRLFAWLAVPVAAPALTYGAWPFWRGAVAALRLRRITLDVTTALVLAISIIASLSHLGSGGDLYLDAAAMFVALLLAGRAVASAARRGAARRVAGLDGLLPDHVLCIDGTGREMPVATGAIAVGDRLVVVSGETIACDGVAEGQGRVSVAVLTGEPRAVAVSAGDAVWAGSRNQGGRMVVRAIACGDDTRIGRLLDQARSSAAIATPARNGLQAWLAVSILLAAISTCVLWWWIDLTRALDQAVGMVLALCPCAFGLAMPLVHAAAIASAGRRGLVVRDGSALEAVARATDMVFDKTGTLTRGEPVVVEWTLADGQAAPWLLAASERSRHPVSLAVAARLRAAGVEPVQLDVWREEPGRGVVADTPLGELRLGSPAHAGLASWPVPAGASPVAAAIAGRPVLRLATGDAPKPGAAELVAAIAARGIRGHLLSGDDPAVVAGVGAALGIPAGRCHGGAMPEDKRARVAGLVAGGATVVMVGDGANDAAAMGAAHAGIGLRGGLAACLDRCSVVVPDGSIDGLAVLLRGARTTRTMIRLCVAVALLYNLVAAGLVLAGCWGPLVCAVAMPASSLTVLAIATLGRPFR